MLQNYFAPNSSKGCCFPDCTLMSDWLKILPNLMGIIVWQVSPWIKQWPTRNSRTRLSSMTWTCSTVSRTGELQALSQALIFTPSPLTGPLIFTADLSSLLQFSHLYCRPSHRPSSLLQPSHLYCRPSLRLIFTAFTNHFCISLETLWKGFE